MSTTFPGHQILPLELIDRITDEVYNSSGNSKEDLYNLSLTSREVGKRATALIFRVVKLKGGAWGSDPEDPEDDVFQLHVLFESNRDRNLAALVRILVFGFPEEGESTFSPSLPFVLGQMQHLHIIKLTGVDPSLVYPRSPFFSAFANRANLTDIRLYNISMKYNEFETILRSNSSLKSLLISSLWIDEFHESSRVFGRHFRIHEPEAVAWEDSKSRYHGLQPKTALELPIERLIMKLATPSDYKVMGLLMSSRLPILLRGSLKRLAISTATGTVCKATADRIIAFLHSSLARSVSQLHLAEYEVEGYWPGSHAPRNLATVHLPLCTTLDLHFAIRDYECRCTAGPLWFSSILETLTPEQLPVKKLLLVFDFWFDCGYIDYMTPPEDFWCRLDNALFANCLDLEEVGVHIILRAEDPERFFPDEDEESEAEETDESESGLEENEDKRMAQSWAGSGEESDAESDPDDSTYITDQSEYTDAEEDEDDVELGKNGGHGGDGKSQDHKEADVTPRHILQHWLFGFVLPKTNSRYQFQQDETNSSASENGVKSWIRFSESTSKIEPIFDIDEFSLK